MEDDHVDRPGVEERQRLKLTGTNSSIGLIVLIPYAHPTKSDGLFSLTLVPPLRAALRGCGASAPTVGRPCEASLRKAHDQRTPKAHKDQRTAPRGQKIGLSLLTTPYWLFAQKLLEQRAFCRPGGYGGAAAPDPIPNSAVKRSSADGTSSQDAGE